MPNNDEIFKQIKEKGLLSDGSYIVQPDDDINFKCTDCGLCCTSPNVCFSPVDVYYAAKKLGIKPFDFVKKYIHPYVGSDSGCIFNTVALDKNNMCVFHDLDLNTGKHSCKLGDCRPYTCAITPFGIITGKKMDNVSDDVNVVIIKNLSCGQEHGAAGITVKDYIDSKMRMTKEEKAASDALMLVPSVIVNSKLIMEICQDKEACKSASTAIGTDIYSKVISTTVKCQYDFDTDRSFIEQAKDIMKNVIINSIIMAEFFIALSHKSPVDFIRFDIAKQLVPNFFDSSEEFDQMHERYW